MKAMDFTKGIVAGAIVGATASMVVSNMDHKKKRAIKRGADRAMKNISGFISNLS